MAAAELWHQAGADAMTSAAYLDAQKHFARGVALIEGVPDSPLRAQRALALMTALATAHLSTQGFGAAETREAFGKARVMCTRLGREAPLEVVGGIFGAALAGADNDETEAILPLFRALAERSENPLQAFAGHQVLGIHACWSGRYALAQRHTTTAMELYRRRSVRGISWEFGFGLYCYAYGMMAEYQRGYADRAERVRLEMMELAEKSGNPYCLALALGFSTTLTNDLGRPDQTIELATRLLAIASEQHLYLWSAFAMCAHGGALVQLGRATEGLAPIRAGVSLLDMLGFRCSYGYYLMYLVEALTACGESDEALAVSDEALVLYASHWTRFPEPNMVRLRGAVLETRGDDDGAEQEYRRAMRLAAADEGRSFELRAATSLARLLRRQGDRTGAVAELSRVHDGFSEGFETGDLRAAGELRRTLVAQH
jgi:ATP/maltotriose-dependent transcriptional regulator MalT